ncbi:hypothetical protein T552_00132 [Pneumocystis carinii B80]|uniref:Uncharacterized protein n=1 Tax=Pneumocystis carinii (strain B80) TaxID=1408658 RepID=A0A0W4ZT09_PNEC8|nr:hypothetical protein T552_00132 [Pneumocystis carinii B80]KTW31489.1 hypothetical protein T552_00132 [Pneumocystis carinii B80]
MLPTPKLSHLRQKRFQQVYEPFEDTFILLDALEQDLDLLRKNSSGSGCVSVFLQTNIFGPSKSLHICTDISLQACEATLETLKINSNCTKTFYLDVIHTDLIEGLYLDNNIDLIIFNPPYVPSESKEIGINKNLGNIWAGGIEGMEVTYRILNSIDKILCAHGLFYLVAISRNKPEKIINFMKTQWNMQSKIVLKRNAGCEQLYVIRFNKSNKTL